MDKYDVIIIGGACAGLSAGLYTGRRALKTLILTKDIGGQAAITTEMENYPGTGVISGPELMNRFKDQAIHAGAEIKMAEVTKIEKFENGFKVVAGGSEYFALGLILGFGLSHRHLGLPRERELIGRGITYCATCDGPLFRNKVVAVVGGGNSALDAASYLSDICAKVYLIVRANKFRGDEVVLVDEVNGKENVEIKYNSQIKEIIGDNKLEKVILESGEEIALNGLFLEIGYVPQTELVKDLVALDERGQIIVDAEGRTNVPGIFAAGDVTNTPFKQAVISAGDGAKAALSASRYIKNIKGEADKPDWAKRKNKQ